MSWGVNRIQGSTESPYEDDAQPSELPAGPYRAVTFSMNIRRPQEDILTERSTLANQDAIHEAIQ